MSALFEHPVFAQKSKKIFDVFGAAGAECYVVGGAVRNPLLGAPIKDVDFSVSSTPDSSESILEKAGIRHIPTGKDHGTITAIIDDTAFEITSFRKDIETDGRRAVTAFGGTLEEDALRRDFTINAIYQNDQGKIVDPLGGVRDIHTSTLRFVGDARARIEEDYLRILRYFRFRSEYALQLVDAELAIIAQCAQGLGRISPERIGQEMRKLMIGASAAQALASARKAGVLQFALPEFDGFRYGKWRHYAQSETLKRDWRVELAAASEEVPRATWRLSNEETKYLETLHMVMKDDARAAIIGQKYGDDLGWWGLHLRAALYHRRSSENALFELRRGARAKFPIRGDDLLPLTGEGKALGELKSALYDEWLAADFAIEKVALMARARELLQNG